MQLISIVCRVMISREQTEAAGTAGTEGENVNFAVDIFNNVKMNVIVLLYGKAHYSSFHIDTLDGLSALSLSLLPFKNWNKSS